MPRRNAGRALRRRGIRRAIVAASQRRPARRRPGLVVAHGLSAVVDDRVEAQAIRDTLGDVPVTAPKSYFGYLGAGSGSLEAAVSVLASARVRAADAELRAARSALSGERDPRPAEAADRPTALILSHTRHGQAAAVVLAAAGGNG